MSSESTWHVWAHASRSSWLNPMPHHAQCVEAHAATPAAAPTTCGGLTCLGGGADASPSRIVQDFGQRGGRYKWVTWVVGT